RAHHFDEALDQRVDPAAVIAGNSAQHDADDEAHRDTEQAHGERDAGAVDHAREHVAAETVGAEEKEGAVLSGTDKVEIRLEQVPELMAVAAAEEAQRLDLAFIGLEFAAHGLGVQFHVEAVDEWPDELAGMEQVQLLRRRVDV